MAKVRNNVVVRGVSGGIGKQVVLRHMRDGSTVVAKQPDFSRRVLSSEQRGQINRFGQAVAYAKEAAGRYAVYAERAAGTLKNAYNVALSDWLRPPVIHQVERGQGCIRVLASDNVMVARVRVTILDEMGEIIEEGEGDRCQVPGVSSLGDWWEYACSNEGQVRVEAWDLAGNRVSEIVR